LLLLSKVAIEKRVVNGLAVLQCHDPKKSWPSLFDFDLAPETDSAVRLHLAPKRGGKNALAPFAQ